jgi:hypothetical protein
MPFHRTRHDDCGAYLQVTGIFRATTMRPNKNHRTIKSVFKTFIDVLHFRRAGKGKIARDTTGSKADERSEAYVAVDAAATVYLVENRPLFPSCLVHDCNSKSPSFAL